MKDMFRNKDNSLTQYAFACGYIHKVESEKKISIELSYETPVYHLRIFDHENGRRISWDSYESLIEAKKEYKKACRKYGVWPCYR